jgi:hypothetical protein
MSYRLYVVSLDQSVVKSRRFRDANPHASERSPCLYVGSTAKSAQERFLQHKQGKFSNRGWVEKFGTCLLPELSGGFEYTSRDSAERAEAQLADSLRERGFAVWSR